MSQNTRFRVQRRSNTTTRQNQAPHGHGNFRIIIVETTTGAEVPLCSTCTHRVSAIQHEDAAFALKSEFEHLKIESVDEEYVDVNALDEIDQNDSLAKKERATRPEKTRSNKRRFGGYDQMISKATNGVDSKFSNQKRVIFPESEYDVLEKKLIDLEFKLANVENGGEEFKKLCKIGVMCEERWASFYCRDYGKPLEEFRNEAIDVLKHNLEIRRGEGTRPSLKSQDGGVPARQLKRDYTTINPSVGIASGRMGSSQTPRDLFRSSSKRNFGQCIPISALAMSPLHTYTTIEQDPCYRLENFLFDVESRLKRCEPDTKEYRELVEQGRRLREEWSQSNEQMRDTKPQDQNHPDYDIGKCVVLGRTRRARLNEEFVVDIVE